MRYSPAGAEAPRRLSRNHLEGVMRLVFPIESLASRVAERALAQIESAVRDGGPHNTLRPCLRIADLSSAADRTGMLVLNCVN